MRQTSVWKQPLGLSLNPAMIHRYLGSSQMPIILVVCSGNVCRSPLAAAILREQYGLDGLTVRSAGTAAIPSHSMCERASAMTGSEGVPVIHRARVLTAQLVEDADLILVAAYEHRTAVARLRPSARRKTFTLKEASVFMRSVVAVRALSSQGGTGAQENTLGPIVRQMNDMRGAGKLAAPKRSLAIFPGRSSDSTAYAEISDGHWGNERAHRKTLEEVAIASRSIGSGLAGILGVPH